jgi:hypothetical protein
MLVYVAFECHANFQINWKSFARRDQHMKCLGYVAPKPQSWQMSGYGSWTGSTVNQLRAHSHIFFIPKVANFVESKLSTWHNIAYFNMNKRSSWNSPKTHPNLCERGHSKLLMTILWLHRTVGVKGCCFFNFFNFLKVLSSWRKVLWVMHL